MAMPAPSTAVPKYRLHNGPMERTAMPTIITIRARNSTRSSPYSLANTAAKGDTTQKISSGRVIRSPA